MRLIDTVTGKFVQILDLSKIPPYAILSHTWEELEQSYQDVVKLQEQYGLSVRDQCPLQILGPRLISCPSLLRTREKRIH